MRIPLLMATYRATIYRLTDYLHYSTSGELQDVSYLILIKQARYTNTHMAFESTLIFDFFKLLILIHLFCFFNVNNKKKFVSLYYIKI